MIWFYWQNQKRSSDFFRKVLSWRIQLCEKTTKNYNKNGIGSDDAPSSSYAILFFRDIYWISLINIDYFIVIYTNDKKGYAKYCDPIWSSRPPILLKIKNKLKILVWKWIKYFRKPFAYFPEYGHSTVVGIPKDTLYN